MQTFKNVPDLEWVEYASSEAGLAMAHWRALERRLDARSFSCSTFWVDSWLSHYGPATPFRFLVALNAGEPCGIALLTQGVGRKLGPVPLRTRHLGTAGEPVQEGAFVEYNRILVDPACRPAFMAGLLKHLRQDTGWDQLRFDGFAPAEIEPILTLLPQTQIELRQSRYANLQEIREAAGGDILSRLGRSTRANIRRRLRDYGELECVWASSLEQADEIFSELVTLHQARWKATGQPGAFASGRFLRFQHDVMTRGVIEHRVVLFRVRHQGQTVGCLMLLVDGNRLLDYLSGFAAFDEKPSPGLVTHYLCMQEALARQFDAYDFLVGDKRHKENLSTHAAELCWAIFSRESLKMKSLAALQALKQRFCPAKHNAPPAHGETEDRI